VGNGAFRVSHVRHRLTRLLPLAGLNEFLTSSIFSRFASCAPHVNLIDDRNRDSALIHSHISLNLLLLLSAQNTETKGEVLGIEVGPTAVNTSKEFLWIGLCISSKALAHNVRTLILSLAH
jgi:hypothetical protein